MWGRHCSRMGVRKRGADSYMRISVWPMGISDDDDADDGDEEGGELGR